MGVRRRMPSSVHWNNAVVTPSAPLARILAILLACWLPPGVAFAHGAYPVAREIFFVETDDGSKPELKVETNFGLVARDPEGRWRLWCEDALVPGVVLWQFAPDGSMVAGHLDGIDRSPDGCGFERASGVSTAVRSLKRMAREGEADVILALLETQDPQRHFVRSVDAGRSFAPVALPPGWVVNALAIDGATHRAAPRILATAQGARRTHALLSSDDFGETWDERPLTDFGDGALRLLAASESGLFVRLTALDRHELWRSVDGGDSFVKVHSLGLQPIFVSEPVPGEVWTSGGWGEVYRSDDGGTTWTHLPNAGDVLCITGQGGERHACVQDVATYDGVRRTSDGGRTWTTVLNFADVVGLAVCPAGTAMHDICTPLWPELEPLMKPPVRPGDGGGTGDGGATPPGGKRGCATAPVTGVVFSLAVAVGLFRRDLRSPRAKWRPQSRGDDRASLAGTESKGPADQQGFRRCSAGSERHPSTSSG